MKNYEKKTEGEVILDYPATKGISHYNKYSINGR